jgi:hypothetical protein
MALRFVEVKELPSHHRGAGRPLSPEAKKAAELIPTRKVQKIVNVGDKAACTKLGATIRNAGNRVGWKVQITLMPEEDGGSVYFQGLCKRKS